MMKYYHVHGRYMTEEQAKRLNPNIGKPRPRPRKSKTGTLLDYMEGV